MAQPSHFAGASSGTFDQRLDKVGGVRSSSDDRQSARAGEAESRREGLQFHVAGDVAR